MVALGYVIVIEHQVICHAYGMLVHVTRSLLLFVLVEIGSSPAYRMDTLLSHFITYFAQRLEEYDPKSVNNTHIRHPKNVQNLCYRTS